MATFIRCIQTEGSLVLFDELVSMEFLDELRVSDDAFLRTDIQDAITAGDLIEIAEPGSTTQAPMILIGEWDANVEANYPAEIYGHSYLISDGGQLTNGSQTETYATGDRIVFNLQDLWEKVGGNAVAGGYNGGVWVVGAEPGSPSDAFSRTDNSDGTVDAFESNGASVDVTIQASASSLGDVPTITFDGNNVDMVVSESGIRGTINFAMSTLVASAVHEDGATDDISLTSTLVPAIADSSILDSGSILVPPRTEFTNNDAVEVSFTVASDVDYVQVRNARALKATSAIAVGAGVGPHTIPAVIRAGVGTESGDIRVGIDIGGNTAWGPWTPTSNTVPRNDTAPSMVKGSVTVDLINPISLLPYEYLDFNGTATIAGNSFSNADSVAVTSGTSGNIGGLPVTTDPLLLETFQVTGVQDVVGSADDKAGNYAIVYTLTKESNGVQSVVSNHLIPYFALGGTLNVEVNSESLLSNVVGYENWIAIGTAGGAAGDEILGDSIVLESGPGGGTWEVSGWVEDAVGAPAWATGLLTRKLIVPDSDLKGVYNWANLSGRTISGRSIAQEVGGPGQYLLAGFESRSLFMAAPTAVQPDANDGRRLDFEVNTYDPTNLLCTNSSWSASSPNYEYEATIDDVTMFIGEYTILDAILGAPGANIVGAGGEFLHGTVWYNKNDFNAQNNGSGTQLITLEETRSPF